VEMTPALLDDWLSAPSFEQELAGLPHIDPAQIRRDAADRFPLISPLTGRVLGRFAEKSRQSAVGSGQKGENHELRE
jgi:hypothetical protein